MRGGARWWFGRCGTAWTRRLLSVWTRDSRAVGEQITAHWTKLSRRRQWLGADAALCWATDGARGVVGRRCCGAAVGRLPQCGVRGGEEVAVWCPHGRRVSRQETEERVRVSSRNDTTRRGAASAVHGAVQAVQRGSVRRSAWLDISSGRWCACCCLSEEGGGGSWAGLEGKGAGPRKKG